MHFSFNWSMLDIQQHKISFTNALVPVMDMI